MLFLADYKVKLEMSKLACLEMNLLITCLGERRIYRNTSCILTIVLIYFKPT